MSHEVINMAIYHEKDAGQKLSKHIKASEWKCKDGTEYFLWSAELISILENVRNHFESAIIINSAYRTPEWNNKVGGTKNSYHIKGMAADIRVKGHTSKEVAEYIAYKLMPDWGGVIRYTNFVHVDVRVDKYRKGV